MTRKRDIYARAVEHHVPQLLDDIRNSIDGQIRISNEEFANRIGVEYTNDIWFFWNMKTVLFGRGIYIKSRTTNGGMELIFRERMAEDELAPSSYV